MFSKERFLTDPEWRAYFLFELERAMDYIGSQNKEDKELSSLLKKYYYQLYVFQIYQKYPHYRANIAQRALDLMQNYL